MVDCDCSLTSVGALDIPFGTTKDLMASILETQVSLTQKIKASLKTTFEKMKTKPCVISSELRPGFIARTSNGEKLELTSDIVHDRQGSASVSPKYPKQVIVYDLSLGTYILDDFTAIDHADPWALIAGRVNTFLNFVNTAPDSIKNIVIEELLNQHSGYFLRTGPCGENLVATEFLASSLYNDAGNLVALNTPGNASKNKKPFDVWVAIIPGLESSLCDAIATDPSAVFSSLLDQSGFIVKFRCDSGVKHAYHGAGLAEGLCSLMTGDPKLSLDDKRKAAIHGIKNQYLLNTMDDHIQVLQTTQDISELVAIRDRFGYNLGKGLGTTEQRSDATEAFVTVLNALTGISTNDVRLTGGSPSTSEDELTITKKELKSERIAREAAVQREQEALAIANAEKVENEKLRAEIQALKKAKLAVSEADV